MLEQYFKNTLEIAGIEALVLFDNQNNILDSWTLPKYNLTVFKELGETFLHVFGLIEHLKYEPNEIVIPFDRGLIYGKTGEKFYTIAIARNSVEVPLIRLALTIDVAEFQEVRKIKKMLRRLPDHKFYHIKSITLDDVEKIMLENILEDNDGN